MGKTAVLDGSIVLLVRIICDRGITVRIIIGLLTLTELFKLFMLTLDSGEHKYIASLADTKEFTSEHLGKNTMKIRNARLVELASDYCICYWNPKNFRSGTGQTVRMAQKKGIEVINLFESASNSVISPVDGVDRQLK